MAQRVRDGAIVGLLLTGLFLAVSGLGWKLAGLPFVPLDLFDWIARVLPGSVLTAGIDWMVAISLALHVGNLSAAAKSTEQLMAIAAALVIGGVVGSTLFVILGYSEEPAALPGTILGAILGACAVLIESQLNRIPSGASVSAAWVVGSFVTAGLAFGWIRDRLEEVGTGSYSDRPSTDPRMTSANVDRRRQVLLGLACATGFSTVLTAIWSFASRRVRAPGARWSDDHQLPNAEAAVTPVAGTRRELTPLEDHYRIDIDTRVPTIDITRWRLKIGGLIDHPLELTLDQLRLEEPLHQFVTLSCISNPVGGDLIGTTRWTGVSLRRLVGRWSAGPLATHLKVMSADGFFETIALDFIERDPRVMLTYAWDSLPLLAEHGFPLRLYVPDLYGMKQPKWIVSIELIDHWEPGYWVTRGWDREGRMKASSVVDAVDVRSAGADREGRKTVPAGGIAHGGARGISNVEVRVDAGEWHEARLRDPLSDTTWVLWRANVLSAEGDHLISVRCYEADGTPQAGGFHSRRLRLS